jgi:DNA-binding transcriptional MerR regulator
MQTEHPMATNIQAQSAGYRIGAVARLTGISRDNLRVWERRYAAVIPERTPSGGRLYSTEDISRLRLMKQLVDSGDSIGAVATLSLEALQARAAQTEQQTFATATQNSEPIRMAVIGEELIVKMEAARDTFSAITLSASYCDLQSFRNDTSQVTADVLLIEQPTLQADTAIKVFDWIRKINATWAIVVYRFAAEHALKKLPKSKCSALRAPVEAKTIEHHCSAVMFGQRAAGTTTGNEPSDTPQRPVTPRRYDDETLARIATMSTTVKCECPHHLAELLAGLSAFEQYSAECESRNPADAALHNYLCTTTAQARHMIEEALDRVIEAEDIKL